MSRSPSLSGDYITLSRQAQDLRAAVSLVCELSGRVHT
jgi:hypothetical protein